MNKILSPVKAKYCPHCGSQEISHMWNHVWLCYACVDSFIPLAALSPAAVGADSVQGCAVMVESLLAGIE